MYTYGSLTYTGELYLFNLVEPSSIVRKVLLQRVCDGHKAWSYYKVLHGECHKGVCGRQFITPEKSAAQIPTLTEIYAMFFMRLQMARFRTCCCA